MIRNYRPHDLEAVVTLFQRSVREVASRDYSPAQVAAWAPDPPDVAAWARRLATGGVFICERNNGIAGFARVDASGCVDLLYVDPKVQRQGVAHELLDSVMSWAATQGICGLYAEVSITARAFFESMGFRVVKRQIVERGGVPLENFRMERNLGAEPVA